MNLEGGKISCKSPIGMALMGGKVGDIVDVNAPGFATGEAASRGIEDGAATVCSSQS